ncbi:MAG: glycosyl transferase, partial [Myxococcota bacterium]
APRVGALASRVEAFPEPVVGEGLRRYVAWQNALLTPADHRREAFVEAPLCHPATMLRAAALAEVGGYREGDFPEDYELWLRLLTRGWELAKLPALHLRWRHHEGRATFAHAKYRPEAFPPLRARYLAPLLDDGAFVLWGAGRTGKALARALEAEGRRPAYFLDVDPQKREARGRPVRPTEALPAADASPFVVVAVGARGARTTIREALVGRGFVEGWPGSGGFLFAS